MMKQLVKQLVAVCMMMVLNGGVYAADDRKEEIAVDAYIYAYPMVLMEVTRRIATNVSAPTGSFAPMNRFAHLKAFPDPSFREVVRPNADTLYSILWFDVSREPQVVTVPDTNGRYYLLPMLDMWTDVFAVPGSRTSGTKAGNFAIVGPDWKGKLPKGVEKLRCPTNTGWIIGRIQTNGEKDYATVHKIQAGIKVIPLSAWGKPYTPPAKTAVDPNIDMKTPPPLQVANMDAKSYFTLFAELLKQNPPHEMDWSMVEQLKRIGLVPGQSLDFDRLDTETKAAMSAAVPEAMKMIVDKASRSGKTVNGWAVAIDGMGTYGVSYLQRANVARIGLGANVAEDALYPMSLVDAENGGVPYSGEHAYVLHFDKDEVPPVHAFWSLTMYDEEMYFTDNPIGRYAIGDRDALQFNKDGSLDIYIQNASPGKALESNWLPAPKGKFDLVLRLYWPKKEVLTGDWNPPLVKRVK